MLQDSNPISTVCSDVDGMPLMAHCGLQGLLCYRTAAEDLAKGRHFTSHFGAYTQNQSPHLIAPIPTNFQCVIFTAKSVKLAFSTPRNLYALFPRRHRRPQGLWSDPSSLIVGECWNDYVGFIAPNVAASRIWFKNNTCKSVNLLTMASQPCLYFT